MDAVLLVFSLENEASFQELYQLYSQLSSQRADVPVIVVGTQGQQTEQGWTCSSRVWGPTTRWFLVWLLSWVMWSLSCVVFSTYN